MADEKQTVAGAYAKIESHEELCAERYANIRTGMDDLKGSIRWAARGVWGAAFALICWLGVQLYNDNDGRITKLENPVAVRAPR